MCSTSYGNSSNRRYIHDNATCFYRIFIILFLENRCEYISYMWKCTVLSALLQHGLYRTTFTWYHDVPTTRIYLYIYRANIFSTFNIFNKFNTRHVKIPYNWHRNVTNYVAHFYSASFALLYRCCLIVPNTQDEITEFYGERCARAYYFPDKGRSWSRVGVLNFTWNVTAIIMGLQSRTSTEY